MNLTAEAWISLAALVISMVFGAQSILTSRRLTRLSEQNAAYELRRNQQAEENQHRANLVLTLEQDRGLIVLANMGEADALNVRLQVRSKGGERDPIARDAARKLPLSRLGPGEQCSFNAAILLEYDVGFDCVVRWRASDGRESAKEIALYL